MVTPQHISPIRTPAGLRAAAVGLALAAMAACSGSGEAARDSAAAASSPDSAGLQTTGPQSEGPMNMIDSSTRAPVTNDSPPGTVRRDSMVRAPGDTMRPTPPR